MNAPRAGRPPAVVPEAWPATGRYAIDQAPGGLGLVQDLLNTISTGVPPQPDLLGDPASAQAWAAGAAARWSAATGRPVPEVVLDRPGLRQLRAFRDELRERMHARIGAAGEAEHSASEAAEVVPTAPGGARATLRLGDDGSVRLDPAGTGADLLICLVLAALYESQLTDTHRRMKICRNPRCRIAFYDRSRNNSGVWHSVRVCGYPTNLRAHRARQRGQAG
jgi:predicted RNA-binding Zn ribbon-like protein